MTMNTYRLTTKKIKPNHKFNLDKKYTYNFCFSDGKYLIKKVFRENKYAIFHQQFLISFSTPKKYEQSNFERCILYIYIYILYTVYIYILIMALLPQKLYRKLYLSRFEPR